MTSGAGRQPPLIDCHAHVWREGMPFAADAWKRLDYAYPVEAYLAELDSHGIRHGVIAAASLFGTYNDYYIDSVRRHPRLRTTAIVDPGTTPARLAQLKDQGVVGIRLQWFFRNPLPDIEGGEFQRFCRNLRALGLHVHLNIEGLRLVEVGSRLLDTGVNLLIDHFGWHDPALRLAAPSYLGMLRMLERNNAWVKLSSGFRHPEEHTPDWSLPVEYSQDLLHRFGPRKLFWGSDAPFVGHEHVASYGMAIERFEQCVPDPVARAAICDNGYRFYFG